MSSYVQVGEFFSVAIITGPQHVLVQIAFSSVPVAEPSLVALPAVGKSPARPLDPQQICRAVLDAAAATNAELGTSFHPATIRYVADDSPCYPLYARGADLIIRRLASGEPFVQA